MTGVDDPDGACEACVRRSWLLAQLSGPLDFLARDRERLMAALALADDELLQAVGGRRKAELRARYDTFAPTRDAPAGNMARICRHHPCYPRLLRGAASPKVLHTTGDIWRLARMAEGPVVAIVGSVMASDYGKAMAMSLARELAVSGVTVSAALTDGIAAGAHDGVLRAGGASLAVLGGGLDVTCAVRHRRLLADVTERGCAIAELPAGSSGRRWGGLASERIVVGLAQVTVVVEARDCVAELAPAQLTRAHGGVVAAMPGRVTSPLSGGTNALLAGGARLIRDGGDVLELLCGCGRPAPALAAAREREDSLSARLRAVLGQVGAGRDTAERLAVVGLGAGEVLLALSELEAMGLLRRGDGGRYLPNGPLVVGPLNAN